MAYTKTVWQDRAVSAPNDYTATGAVTGTVTLVPKPGTVTQAGTPLNAANLNNLENGVYNAVQSGANSSEIDDILTLFNEVDSRNIDLFRDSNGILYGILEEDGSIQGTSTANFVGKVAGSTVENPHIMKRQNGATSLQTPTGSWGENDSAMYGNVATLNGTLVTSTKAAVNGEMPQHLFSFDLVAIVERLLGFPIANDLASKVAWIKANLANVTCNWYGYGSSPLGNKAYLGIWRASNSSWWTTFLNHTNATVTKLAYDRSSSMSPPLSDMIDSNGIINYIAYADASNGTVASTINTDYVELVVTFNSTLLRGTAINRTLGQVSSVVQKCNGKTITVAINRTAGKLTGITKTVI